MKPHPCTNCLVISVCKQRTWVELLNNCWTIRSYMFSDYNRGSERHDIENTRVRQRVERTFIELYPNYWKPAEEGSSWTWETKVIKS